MTRTQAATASLSGTGIRRAGHWHGGMTVTVTVTASTPYYLPVKLTLPVTPEGQLCMLGGTTSDELHHEGRSHGSGLRLIPAQTV